MKFPKVSIIIPNWNGKKFLEDCLESLSKIDWPDYQIIVIDNDSTDESVEFIKNNFRQIILIENQKNLGFSAACNQGIRWALEHGTNYILLLNNDTVVAPDFLTKMMVAAKIPKTGIVGAKIFYFNQPKKIWFAGGDFIWWRVSGKHRFWQKLDNPKLIGIKFCDFITGCAMLIKKEVFDDVGYFYEPYFLTIEDLDFCWRTKMAGWKIVVNLDAHIWHKVSSSRLGEFSFSNGYYGTRNRLFFAIKRTKNILGTFIFLCLVIPVRLIQWIFLKKYQMFKGTILGVWDFFRNKMGLRDI